MRWASISFCVSCSLGLLVALIYKIYSKVNREEEDLPSHERKGEKIRRLAFYFLGEMSLTLIILFLPIYTLSLFYQILFSLGTFNLLSYVYAFGFGLILVVFFVALIKSKLK